MEQTLEFRLATPADKAQVLVCHGDDAGSIYKGLDYLPERFELSLSAWNKVCGLCFDRSVGMVVAYAQIIVFDNKRHMLLTALRVHKQYQGRGIARELRNFLCRETRKRFPDVEPEIRFGVYGDEFSRAEFYASNPDYQMMSKRHYYMLDFPLSQLPQLQVAISSAAATAAAAVKLPSRLETQWTDRETAFNAMLADSSFRRIFNGLPISINFEVIELMEENEAILPGLEVVDSQKRKGSLTSVIASSGEDLTLGFGCSIYCARGLRVDLDLYHNSIDKAEFSPDSLTDISAALLLQFLERSLASESNRLSRMPTKSFTLFLSLDCLNPKGFGCPNCDLEQRLAARIRGLINGKLIEKHPFYTEGRPYPLIRKKVPLE